MRKRKSLVKILGFLLCLLFLLVFPAFNQDLITKVEALQDGDYTYTDNGDSTATITNYTGSDAVITIPGTVGGLTVTILGPTSFYNGTLTSVTIPNSVTSIGSNAFGYNSLTSLTIPNTVTSIGGSAFRHNSITSVTIGTGITSLETAIFQDNSLTSVTIPSNIISIGGYAFDGNSSLSSVSIPSSVTSIGDSAFYENAITSVTIPSSVLSIGENAFRSNSLTSLTISSGVTSIGNYAFRSNSLTSVSIPSSVTSIGNNAFQSNSLTSATISSGVTSIGSDAFSYNSLTGITIPDTVTSIGSNAFKFNSLTSVTIGTGITSLGEGIFQENSLTSVTIPSNITSIGTYAFYNNSLTSITIPSSVTSLGTYAFSSNSLTSATIPSSVTSIGNYAFYDNSLTSVTIPGSVSIIGEHAFRSNSLTSLTISSGVTSIGNYAFRSNSLTSVSIPSSVTSIGSEVFAVNSLTSITIPDTVTSIGNNAFKFNNLTSVTIGTGITSIGEGVFQENSLTSVTIPNNVTSIGSNAFSNNTLTDFELPSQSPGYTAATWSDGAVTYSSGDTVTDLTKAYNETIAGTLINYNLTYNLDGGTNHGSNPATYTVETATITLENPTKTGYTFGGWYTESEFTNEVTEITTGSTGNVTLYAKWTAITYDIIYNLDGGLHGSNPATYTIETATITLDDPTKTGYTFGGWYTESEFTNEVTEITTGSTGNVTLYAKWTINEYTVSFNGNTNDGGSVPTSITQNYDTEVTTPGNTGALTKTGYTFNGWNTQADGGGTTYVTDDTSNMPATNTILYAQWMINEYTVSFNGNTNDEGSVPTAITQNYNTTVTVPENTGLLTKTGYTFNGWNTQADGGGTTYITDDTFNMPASSTILYARWSTIEYDITYNLNGGTNHGSNPATYTIETATITLDDPTKTGYTFAGWFTESGFTNEVTEITSGSTSDITLYIQWELIIVPEEEAPSTVVEEEEEEEEEVSVEEITEEEIAEVIEILEELKDKGEEINQEENVTITVGKLEINTKGKEVVHIYQDSNLEISIPIDTLTGEDSNIDNVYAVLGENVIKLALNIEGDKYIGTLITKNITGEQSIDILTIFEDNSTKKSVLGIYIDPYGYVYALDKDENQVRIKDATVSLYKIVDGERTLYTLSDQDNPQTTDVEGQYSFMVEPGTYILVVEAKGYKDYDSGEFEVEKTIVEMNIELEKKFNIFDYWLYILIGSITIPLFIIVAKKKGYG